MYEGLSAFICVARAATRGLFGHSFIHVLLVILLRWTTPIFNTTDLRAPFFSEAVRSKSSSINQSGDSDCQCLPSAGRLTLLCSRKYRGDVVSGAFNMSLVWQIRRSCQFRPVCWLDRVRVWVGEKMGEQSLFCFVSCRLAPRHALPICALGVARVSK